MKRASLSCTLAAVALCMAAPAFAQSTAPAKTAETSKGKVWTDPSNGMTLYERDSDPAGKSTCTGKCAANWPPFIASASAKASGQWSIIKRSDGLKQWAYKGKPLYLWSKDKKPGDVTGDGVAKVWHVAKAA